MMLILLRQRHEVAHIEGDDTTPSEGGLAELLHIRSILGDPLVRGSRHIMPAL